MSECFAIHASIATDIQTASGPVWHGCRHLPTFYLHRNVQGILSEDGACRVARTILDPFDIHGERLVIGAAAV